VAARVVVLAERGRGPAYAPPMSSHSLLCPGAIPLAGPPPLGPSSICGPLALDQEKEEQVGMQGRPTNVVFTSRKDGSTYEAACCGNYTECLIWQAERRRLSWGLNTLQEVSDLQAALEADDL
jgi:hypothetical protein